MVRFLFPRPPTGFVVGLVAVGLAVPAALPAQDLEGSGPLASSLFVLTQGLAVFDFDHEGEGAFRVRLLDERGRTIDDIAVADGNVSGSRALHVQLLGV